MAPRETVKLTLLAPADDGCEPTSTVVELRFEFAEIAMLREAYPDRDPRDLVQNATLVSARRETWGLEFLFDDDGYPIPTAPGDDFAILVCLWACLRRKQRLISREAVATLIESHEAAGGHLLDIASAVGRAWWIGGSGRKVLAEIKKNQDSAKAQQQLVVEQPEPELGPTSPSASEPGSEPSSEMPAAAA